ncbi:hypothetical protein HDU79_011899 [Rhizoclosmatium sp. JEL0117]|nr:hypothetical protein HDU79_011899 [Rhizoclosmatium sp. JEL0117]
MKKIVENTTLNVAITSGLETPLAQAVTHVLDAFQTMSTASTVKPDAVVKTNCIYSFNDLHLAQQEAVEAAEEKRKASKEKKNNRKQAKEAAKTTKLAVKEAKLCQAQTPNSRCTAVWKSSPLWLNCNICEKY